ncbi:FtsW/RodA/SpoVE family cell cycle protein, partial [candidate division KSB1 bacterium]|nr:FtsW/RodA/SpoVE family cell cycle protein [candidate division KSB1 bacterium]
MSDQRIQIQRDYMLLTVVLVLVAIGIVMVYSASSVIAGARFGDSNYYLKRHIMRVCIGLVSMFIVYRINYRHFQKVALPGLFISIGLLLLMLFAGSESVNGSVRWLSFGSFSFQPSEIVKITFLIYLATWLAKKGSHGISDIEYG